jgi:hypothetical protein
MIGLSETIKRAFVNVAAAQTDSVVVAAVPTKILKVMAVVAVAGGTATDLTFNSKGSGAGTAISPKFANGANGGEVLNVNPFAWFQTNVGEGLTVTTGAGSATGVLVLYIED